MPEKRITATSGVFLRPVWRKVPSGMELGLALIFSVLPFAGLLALTFQIGRSVSENPDAGSSAGGSRAGMMILSSLSHSSSSSGSPESRNGAGNSRVSGQDRVVPTAAAPEPAKPSFWHQLSRGRRILSRGLKASAASTAGNAGKLGARDWAILAVLVLAGPVFCFFAWPLRRAATALLGAYALGSVAFMVSTHCGMNWSAAMVISLAPAFLGALVGWHLVLFYTTMLSGQMLGGTAALLLYVRFGPVSWMPFPVLLILCWSVMTAMIYLLALRPALISGWAVLGAGIVSFLLVMLTGMLVNGMALWDLFLCLFLMMTLLGTITQYRFVTRVEEGAEPVPDR